MRWLMRFLGWSPPPEHTDSSVDRDPAFAQRREAYQQDKQAAREKQAETLARLKRMGYDLDIATAKKGDDATAH
jgi:phosphoglycolate phosphatase-like HAD superfamily hydrolase